MSGPAIVALGSFFAGHVAHREQLVLPLHGGPQELSETSARLRRDIYARIEAILERGHDDHTVRDDVTTFDIVFFAAMLAQPLSGHHGLLETNLRRQQHIFLAGLAPAPSGLENA